MKPARLAFFLAFLVGGTAAAGEMSDPLDIARHIFGHADSDGNGVLVKAEHDAAGLDKYGVAFEAFDADDNGEVSWQEYRTLFEKYHPARKNDPI